LYQDLASPALLSLLFLFFSPTPPPPTPPLFPYTTLFRSPAEVETFLQHRGRRRDRLGIGADPPTGAPRRGRGQPRRQRDGGEDQDRKSTRLNSSHGSISYAVFCLKKKKKTTKKLTYI